MAITRELKGDYTREGSGRSAAGCVGGHYGASLEHIASYSFDPDEVRGNVENFAGATQVPLGLAGPLRVNGEHAQGEFLMPLATSEGTLVASYNRGMKVAREAGGTQREALELLGCYGEGKVRKLAEIVAATVLCGELSLGAAIVSDEWVDAHERLGRNR